MYNAAAAGGTLNSHRAACTLARLVEREEKWEATDHPQSFDLNIGVEPSKIVLLLVWCSKLRLTSGVQLALFRDEFRGSLSDVTVDQSGIRNYIVMDS
ncbi:hypothetical protein TNCV_233491 [Trichonephila clavipes]|nr:hypothetical protein TNCV_233491 [Trichonephila clavipes]